MLSYPSFSMFFSPFSSSQITFFSLFLLDVLIAHSRTYSWLWFGTNSNLVPTWFLVPEPITTWCIFSVLVGFLLENSWPVCGLEWNVPSWDIPWVLIKGQRCWIKLPGPALSARTKGQAIAREKTVHQKDVWDHVQMVMGEMMSS